MEHCVDNQDENNNPAKGSRNEITKVLLFAYLKDKGQTM